MARKGYIRKRQIEPDSRYQSILVARFINKILERGKKTLAQNIIYKSFDIIKERTKKEPLEVFEAAISNASPQLEVKSKRIGGASYQIPMEVRGDRKSTLAMRWIIAAAKAKKGKPMYEKLALEILDASKNEGEAVKKKEDTHRMADANKAFAHLARF